MNHASWLKEHLSKNTSLRLITDSSFFINFNDDIQREFNAAVSSPLQPNTINQSSSTATMQDSLFSIIAWHEPCRTMHVNAPCCISLHCLLATPQFYPKGVELFGIISLYDVFLLGASLRGLATLASQEEALKPGYALDFLRTVAEYGGAMNRTIVELESGVNFFSYYVTGCFQHIYLATSTLWGTAGQSLFGNGLVELNNNIGVIRYV